MINHKKFKSSTENDVYALQTDFYNLTAESYFASQKNSEYLRRKPFSTAREMAESLYRFSILVAGLDLNATDLVMDFGAGTCWVSLLLSRAGINSVAVDVSATALEIGRKIFETTPPEFRGTAPGFVSYDGYRLPFEDNFFSAIVCHDAFHHVPNKKDILREMFRVLTPGGRVAFSEPGEGHSRTTNSLRETKNYGVLESDIILKDIDSWAREVGFDGLTLWPLPNLFSGLNMDWNDARKFMDGSDDKFPIDVFRHSTRAAPFFFLQKGKIEPDSRHFNKLLAEIRHPGIEKIEVKAGCRWEAVRTVKNIGDTRWLAGPLDRGGDVYLGAHLFDASGGLLNWDYGRVALTRDIPPGCNETLLVQLTAPESPGNYIVELDMVVERVTWFAEQGSSTARINLKVI